MLSLYEGFFFKKNEEFEKNVTIACEWLARAQVERYLAENKHETYSKASIEDYVQDVKIELTKKYLDLMKDEEVRRYFKNLDVKDEVRELRASRWTNSEIEKFKKFYFYMQKAVKAYEKEDNWK